jgi:DNA-binding MarR family transcriptional regulator
MTKIDDTSKDGIDVIVDEWGKAGEGIDLALLELQARISRTSLFMERHVEAFCREYGFGFGECDLLLTLRRGGPPYTRRPTDLSQASLVTSGATTGRIDRLVALGLVDRVSSTTDRRAAHVHLTRHGWDVTGVLIELIKNSPLHAAGPFTPAEVEITISVLRRIGYAFGDVPASADAPPPVPQEWQGNGAGMKRRAGKRS